MKQKKSALYKESSEGKVSFLLKRLYEGQKLQEKIKKLRQKIDKMKQMITTNPEQVNELKETIAQFEFAIANYEEEIEIHHFNDEDRKVCLDKIREIISQIEPLPICCENEKQIHKNLKHLNRFEEHLLILRTKTTDKDFLNEVQNLLRNALEKKNLIIMKMDSIDQIDKCKVTDQFQQLKISTEDSFSETPTLKPDDIETLPSFKSEPEQQIQFNTSISENNSQLISNVEQFNTPTSKPDEQQEQIVDQQFNQTKQENQKVEITSENQNVQEPEQLCDQYKCQICFAHKRKYVAIPCGHFIYCEQCKPLVEKQMKCLLCRQTVCQLFEVFI